MSSNYTPNVEPGINFQTSVVLLRKANLFYPGGSTVDNLNLVDASNDNDPIGYLHLHQVGPGDVSFSGFRTPFNKEHAPLLFVKNDGPNNVILLEQSLLSVPDNRFDFAGGGNITLPPATLGASILLIYDSDIQRWQPGP